MRRILIIEDDAETRAFIAQGFSDEGYATETADNGRDGLYLATDSSFDAIILDRMLPELDGLSLLKSLRAAGLKTPVLLLTAVWSAWLRLPKKALRCCSLVAAARDVRQSISH